MLITLTTGQTMTVLQVVSPLWSLYNMLTKFDSFDTLTGGGDNGRKCCAYTYIILMTTMMVICTWAFIAFFSSDDYYPARFHRDNVPRPTVKADWV